MGLSERPKPQLRSRLSQVGVWKGKVESVLLRFCHLLFRDSEGVVVPSTQNKTTGADV